MKKRGSGKKMRKEIDTKNEHEEKKERILEKKAFSFLLSVLISEDVAFIHRHKKMSCNHLVMHSL